MMRRLKRAKLFVFLGERGHEIFEEGFQEELGTLYSDSRLAHPPLAPAKLALATILEAYTGASEEEAMEAMVICAGSRLGRCGRAGLGTGKGVGGAAQRGRSPENEDLPRADEHEQQPTAIGIASPTPSSRSCT